MQLHGVLGPDPCDGVEGDQGLFFLSCNIGLGGNVRSSPLGTDDGTVSGASTIV
jgi:hypothetical protein